MLLTVQTYRSLYATDATDARIQLAIDTCDEELQRIAGKHFIAGDFTAYWYNLDEEPFLQLPRYTSTIADPDTYYISNRTMLYRRDGMNITGNITLGFTPVDDNATRTTVLAELVTADLLYDGYQTISELGIALTKQDVARLRNRALARVKRMSISYVNYPAHVTEPEGEPIAEVRIMPDTWWFLKPTAGLAGLNLARLEPMLYAEELAIPDGGGYLVYARSAQYGIPTFRTGGFAVGMTRFPNAVTVNNVVLDVYVSNNRLLPDAAGGIVSIDYPGG